MRHGGEQIGIDLHVDLGVDRIESVLFLLVNITLVAARQLLLDPRGILGLHADRREGARGRSEFRAGRRFDKDLVDVSCVGVELEVLFGDLGVIPVTHRLRGRRWSLKRLCSGSCVQSLQRRRRRGVGCGRRLRRRLGLNGCPGVRWIGGARLSTRLAILGKS